MKKVLKRVTAAALAAMVFVLLAACTGRGEKSVGGNTAVTPGEAQDAAEGGNGLDWLDVSGKLPIVKEGTDKTLKLAARMNVDSGNPEDMWFFKFVEDAMNIDLEVDKFTDENVNEYLSLAFAGGSLPDVIVGGSMTATDLVTYGAVEGQLLDLAPYINENYMPNLAKIYAEYPEYKAAVTDSEGQVWSLGYINDPADRGQIPRYFINYDWLEEEGLKVPASLDEFVDMLRAFKKRGDSIIPMGGAYEYNNPCLIVLNAYGYNTTDPKGLSIALRDGRVVLPVADREAYGEYLKTMHTIYSEGLIDPDFYTTDSATSDAIASEDRVGVLAQAPFVFMSDFSAWWGGTPLTSSYETEPMWPASTSSINAGNFVVSTQCENPELAVAFADWFFGKDGQNYEFSTSGPASTQTDYLYDMVKGFEIDPDTKAVTWIDVAENPDLYSSKGDFINKKVALWTFKFLGLGNADSTLVKERLAGWPEEQLDDGYPDTSAMEDPSELRGTLTDGEMHFRIALEDTLKSYVQNGYPSVVYLDQETALEAANLFIVVKEYAEQEAAKFITGARSLEELEAYFTEIERLGAAEYVKIYQDYYDGIK